MLNPNKQLIEINPKKINQPKIITFKRKTKNHMNLNKKHLKWRIKINLLRHKYQKPQDLKL